MTEKNASPQNEDILPWDEYTLQRFNAVLEKMPKFLRPTAEKIVHKKAAENALSEKSPHITEKNLIDAFFSETPFGFHGPMMTDLEEAGLDYKKYGHPIDYTQGFFKKNDR